MNITHTKVLLVLFITIFGTCFSIGQVKVSTESDIKPDLALAPCENKDRLTAAKDLFERMGAKAGEINIEKLGKLKTW